MRRPAVLTNGRSALEAIARNGWREHRLVGNVVLMKRRIFSRGIEIAHFWMPAHNLEMILQISLLHSPLRPTPAKPMSV